MSFPLRVVIKGAGDLASGVAHRLWYSGFDIVMLELPRPLVVRRTAAFACAVFEGTAQVEGVRARLCSGAGDVNRLLEERVIPVLVDPQGSFIPELQPDVLVDAVMAKRNTGTKKDDAPIVIALGPGFEAGTDAHAVIETKRGHHLGRVIYRGSAAENTGIPGSIAGFSAERLLRAPVSGVIKPFKEIGSMVEKGETVAAVDGVPVTASLDGLLRGMLYPGLPVKKGMKIGDIDPRGKEIDCYAISDKARSIGGGVLEALLHFHFKERF